LRFLQSSGGLSALRDVGYSLFSFLYMFDVFVVQSLWAPVMQYSDRGTPFVLSQISLMADDCHFTRNVAAIFRSPSQFIFCVAYASQDW
jgi:hypothetical protein